MREMWLKRGCHAVMCGVDFADAPIVKITQSVSLVGAFNKARSEAGYIGAGYKLLCAVRPHGTCKWTLYKGSTPIMRHHELDYLRMRAALEGLE